MSLVAGQIIVTPDPKESDRPQIIAHSSEEKKKCKFITFSEMCAIIAQRNGLFFFPFKESDD